MEDYNFVILKNTLIFKSMVFCITNYLVDYSKGNQQKSTPKLFIYVECKLVNNHPCYSTVIDL